MSDESEICLAKLTSSSEGQHKFLGLKDKRRKVQKCTFCKNHSLEVPKKGHQCPFKECACALCNLQRKAQMTMRQQQRFWRHQKIKLRQATCGISSHYLENIYGEKGQLCDMCRNHNKLTLKKNHCCPFSNCGCQRCTLTFKRRELMKRLQRVRRSKITCLANIPDTSRSFWPSDIQSTDPRTFAETFCCDARYEEFSKHSFFGETRTRMCEENSSGSLASSPRDFYIKLNSNELIMKYKMLSSVPLQRIASPPPLIPLIPSPPPSPESNSFDSLSHPNRSPPSLDPLYINETLHPSSATPPIEGSFVCNNLFHHSKSSQFRPKYNSTNNFAARLAGSYYGDHFSQKDRERFLSLFLSNISSKFLL